MLSIRLRTAQSIRAPHLSTSRCRHIPHAGSLCRTRAAELLAQSYATKSKSKSKEQEGKKQQVIPRKSRGKKAKQEAQEAKDAAAQEKEAVDKADAGDSKKAKSPATSTPKSSSPKKAKKEAQEAKDAAAQEKEAVDKADAGDSKKAKSPATSTPKSTSPKKTKASPASATETSKTPIAAPSIPTKKKTKPGTHSPHDDSIDVMKEALAVLRDFQDNPSNYALTNKESRAKGEQSKQSLRSQFAPIQGGQPKLDSRQKKILTGTLDVLKSALTIQAERRAQLAKRLGDNTQQKISSQEQQSKRGPPQTIETTKKVQRKPQQAPEKAAAEQEIIKSAQEARASLAANPDLHAVSTGRPSPLRKSSKATQPLKPRKKRNEAPSRPIRTFEAEPATALTPVDAHTPPVPLIQYGLDRVLFNEGVYALQDPRTRVWNFDPYLGTIMPVKQFDFDALKEYITSSKDTLLLDITKQHKRKYTGSTSSMTSTLAHFHYLLSGWRPINQSLLSKGFEVEHDNFSALQRAPAGTFLNYRDGAYAIDADKQWDSDTILSMLGKSMEKLLTVPKEEFEKYRRSNSHQLTEEERNQDESYHYTTYGDFMMRSQLDCYDPRLPGTGIYDLKTRAVVSVRMDARHHEKGSGYEIRQRLGQWESFEREYFDMIRSAFLKYSLQVRMGRMDGIFVAYHNTERIFGFQYVPLEEMDQSMHGTRDKTIGDREFTASLKLWNELLNKATERFPEQSLRVFVETKHPAEGVPFLYFFAEPVTEEEIKQIQEKKKEDVDYFRKHVLGMDPENEEGNLAADSEDVEEPNNEIDEEAANKEVEADEDKESEVAEEEDSEDVWEDMMEVVERTMDNDAQGITAIREAIEQALEQSGLLRAKSSEEAQHFVDSLLKSIVDINSERPDVEVDIEASADLVEAEKMVFSAAKDDTESRPVQQSATSQPKAPDAKKSAFGFLKSWFGSSSSSASVGMPPTDSPEQLQAAQRESDSITGPNQDEASETSDSADKDTDEKPSAELVDLIVKLTSRVGSKTSATKDTQERPEDLAKLDLFRSILSNMMTESEEDLGEDMGAGTSSSKPAHSAEPAATSKGSVAEEKSLFGMTLTVRNKVGDKHVDRPENLKSTDKWTIEYTMEEMTDQKKAQTLLRGLKSRRKLALTKTDGFDSFRAFGNLLPMYSAQGRAFRAEETEYAKHNPVWIVGQPEPLDSKDVFQGAGVPLNTVLPKYERPPAPDVDVQPDTELKENLGAVKERPDKVYRNSPLGIPARNTAPKKRWNEGKEVENVNMAMFAHGVVNTNGGSAAETQKPASASFKEWRERDKKAQKPGS